MKKGLYILILFLAASMFFASCSGRDKTPTVSREAETAALPTLPENLDFPEWVPENELKRAYNYALFSASQHGYACDFVEERIEESSADAKSFFAEDGQGFCLYSVFSGMSQREFLLLGTADYGKTWSVFPETIHVTTYLNDPIPNGDCVLIQTSNALEISESVLVIKRDGTDIKIIGAESLVPEDTLLDADFYYTVTSIAVNPDQSVAFELAAHNRETGEIALDNIQATLDKDLRTILEASNAKTDS